MRKYQAEDEGYVFTGAFSWNKEEIKERARKERKDGYRAVVVTEPPNKLSRGHHGTGYSVYKKPTDKKLAEIEADKKAIEKKNLDDYCKVQNFLHSQEKGDLVLMFNEAKGDKLMSWARELRIID